MPQDIIVEVSEDGESNGPWRTVDTILIVLYSLQASLTIFTAVT